MDPVSPAPMPRAVRPERRARSAARAQEEATGAHQPRRTRGTERVDGDMDVARKTLIKRAIPDVHLFNETRATARYDYTAYPALPDILKKPSKKDPDVQLVALDGVRLAGPQARHLSRADHHGRSASIRWSSPAPDAVVGGRQAKASLHWASPLHRSMARRCPATQASWVSSRCPLICWKMLSLSVPTRHPGRRGRVGTEVTAATPTPDVSLWGSRRGLPAPGTLVVSGPEDSFSLKSGPGIRPRCHRDAGSRRFGRYCQMNRSTTSPLFWQ